MTLLKWNLERLIHSTNKLESTQGWKTKQTFEMQNMSLSSPPCDFLVEIQIISTFRQLV